MVIPTRPLLDRAASRARFQLPAEGETEAARDVGRSAKRSEACASCGDDGGTFLKRSTRERLLSSLSSQSHPDRTEREDAAPALPPALAVRVKRWKWQAHTSASPWRRLRDWCGRASDTIFDALSAVAQRLFLVLMMVVDEGVFEVFLLVAVPLYAAILSVHALLGMRDHAQRHEAAVAAGLHGGAATADGLIDGGGVRLLAPPAPPTTPFWVEEAVEHSFDVALSRPGLFLAVDFGVALAIGAFFLFLKDLTKLMHQSKINAARRRAERMGFAPLDDVEGACGCARRSQQPPVVCYDANQAARVRVLAGHGSDGEASVHELRRELVELTEQAEMLQVWRWRRLTHMRSCCSRAVCVAKGGAGSSRSGATCARAVWCAGAHLSQVRDGGCR